MKKIFYAALGAAILGLAIFFSAARGLFGPIQETENPKNNSFVVVADDPEGPVDPSKMSLSMKKWFWQKAAYADGREILPRKPGYFSIAFSQDGTLRVDTDCNSGNGIYRAENGLIKLTDIALTERACQESQEYEFVQILREASGYSFTPEGGMNLDLESGRGSAAFK